MREQILGAIKAELKKAFCSNDSFAKAQQTVKLWEERANSIKFTRGITNALILVAVASLAWILVYDKDLLGTINTIVRDALSEPNEVVSSVPFESAFFSFISGMLDALFEMCLFVSITFFVSYLLENILDQFWYRGLDRPSEDEFELSSIQFPAIYKTIDSLETANFDQCYPLLKVLNNRIAISQIIMHDDLKSALMYCVAEMGNADGAFKVSELAKDKFTENDHYKTLCIAEGKGSLKAAKQLSALVGNSKSSSNGWICAALVLGITIG